jgi:hypothetical protein
MVKLEEVVTTAARERERAREVRPDELVRAPSTPSMKTMSFPPPVPMRVRSGAAIRGPRREAMSLP